MMTIAAMAMNGMQAARRWLGTAALGTLLAMAGCGGGNGGPGGGATGTLSGTVVETTTANALSGVVVTAGSASTTTAADGSFTLAGLPVASSQVVTFRASGHARGVATVSIVADATAYAYPRLAPVGVSTNFDPAMAATIAVPGSTAQVSLPASGLVTASGAAPSGNVTAAVTVFDPLGDAANMPGNYSAVPAAGGATQVIESFGAIDVTLTDSAGATVNLATGKTATIRIPLSTRSANPPALVPLYWLDEATGLWMEQGTATLSGTAPDLYYEGTVGHFTAWNADQPMSTIYVHGCVKDDKGAAVANAQAASFGVDYTGRSYAATAADGTFTVPIRKGGIATVFAQVGPLTTNVVQVGPSQTDITLPACLVLSATGVAPQFVEQPATPAGTVHVDTFVQLTSTAVGSPVLKYQWLHDGVAIPNATGSYLVFPSVQASDQGNYTVTATNAYGSATSTAATLTVDPTPLPPDILGQPQPASVQPGATATFTVVALANGGTLSYQWLRDGNAIVGATNLSYTTAATTLADNGALFSVVVSSTNGTQVTSQAAQLSVVALTPLTIDTEPADTSVQAGQSAGFSVTVSGGTVAPSYQWRLNGTPIAGATAAAYTTPATVIGDNGGRYSVVVTSGSETVTSRDATLTVTQITGSGAYYLIASAGPVTQGTVTFANGAQSATLAALLAVNTATPGIGAVTLEAAGQANIALGTVYEGSIAGGQITHLRSRLATYFKGSQLYAVDQVVPGGGAPASRPLSSLATTDICGDSGFPSTDSYGSGNDYAAPMHSWLFFRAPGPDASCNTGDDVFRAVRLDMAATDTAKSIGEPLTEILGADGSFAGLVVRDGNQVQQLDATLTTATHLFTIDAASFTNLGTRFGTVPGTWLFAEGGRVWGVNLATPATRVPVATLATGETVALTGATDASSAFIALNTATGARVLNITQALVVTPVTTLGAPVQQLALSPTRLVIATGSVLGNSSSVVSVPKTGGATTPLGTYVAAGVGGAVVSGENVYLPEFTISGMGAAFSTFIIATDGSNPQTLTNTEIVKTIGPASFPLAGGNGDAYAVVLADGITGFGTLNGATLRAIDGATRGALVTYGSFATDGIVTPTFAFDPLQYGQPGLLTVAQTTGVEDLYFYQSDAAGLVRVTTFIAASGVRAQSSSSSALAAAAGSKSKGAARPGKVRQGPRLLVH